MNAHRKAKVVQRVATIPLALASEQASRLQQWVVEVSKAKVARSEILLKSSKHSVKNGVYELNAQIVCVHADSIEVPGLPRLGFERGHRLKGFNSSMDLLFLLSGPNGWSIEFRFRRPPKKKAKKKPSEQRYHNDAAIFVTEKAGYRVWSGGLPSLGKRR